MRVSFLGTGSAMPAGDRAQTGILVEDDGFRLLLDCGSGVLGRLARTEVGYQGVESVLLSHHHLDHIADLLPLVKARWLAGEEFLELVGPAGTDALISGLLDVHDYMKDRLDLTVREVGAGGFSVAGFEIEAIETRHSVPCLAYRVSGDGDFTFSGDSEAFRGLADFADGSAVLAHDCSFPDGVEASNHPRPAELGAALAGHEYGTVYLTHLYPHTQGRHREMLDSVAKHYDGEVRFARDELTIEV